MTAAEQGNDEHIDGIRLTDDDLTDIILDLLVDLGDVSGNLGGHRELPLFFKNRVHTYSIYCTIFP